MDTRLTIIYLLGIAIVLFITSIVMRKKRRLRLFLRSVGILVGIIPILLYSAFSLYAYIQERQFVGTYEFKSEDVGYVRLLLLENNTFEMKAQNCAAGFVQGEWEYKNITMWTGALNFTSTSQTMGIGNSDSTGNIYLTHIPICLKLVRDLTFVKISESTEEVKDEFSF